MKIHSFLLLVIATMTMAFSCKKDKTPDNPNVTHIGMDSVSVVASNNSSDETPMDIDRDGAADFVLEATDDGGISSTRLTMAHNNLLANFITDLDGKISPVALMDSVSAPKPPKPKTEWRTTAVCSVVNTSTSDVSGQAGKGDFYVGFYFYIGAKIHNGWLKLNVAANGRTIHIKEAAYNTIAEQGLTVGEE